MRIQFTSLISDDGIVYKHGQYAVKAVSDTLKGLSHFFKAIIFQTGREWLLFQQSMQNIKKDVCLLWDPDIEEKAMKMALEEDNPPGPELADSPVVQGVTRQGGVPDADLKPPKEESLWARFTQNGKWLYRKTSRLPWRDIAFATMSAGSIYYIDNRILGTKLLNLYDPLLGTSGTTAGIVNAIAAGVLLTRPNLNKRPEELQYATLGVAGYHMLGLSSWFGGAGATVSAVAGLFTIPEAVEKLKAATTWAESNLYLDYKVGKVFWGAASLYGWYCTDFMVPSFRTAATVGSLAAFRLSETTRNALFSGASTLGAARFFVPTSGGVLLDLAAFGAGVCHYLKPGQNEQKPVLVEQKPHRKLLASLKNKEGMANA